MECAGKVTLAGAEKETRLLGDGACVLLYGPTSPSSDNFVIQRPNSSGPCLLDTNNNKTIKTKMTLIAGRYY